MLLEDDGLHVRLVHHHVNDAELGVRELLGHLVCRLVPDGRQHLGEPAPVRVEVDQDKIVVLDDSINVARVKLNSTTITELEEKEQRKD